MSKCLVGIGANLGDRAQTIRKAMRRLAEHPATVAIATSGTHETSPVGGPVGQPDFLNATARFETSLDPVALLDLLQQIEQDCGRQRGEHWAARTLDLDLLLYDAQVITSQRLAVPHPRMSFRRFVLQPAAEVAAEMIHARMGWTVRQLLDHLDVSTNYLAIGGGNSELRRRLAQEIVAGLGARYLRDAAPGSRPLARQTAPLGLESLQTQARVLAAASWPGNIQLAVSDFWLDGWSLAAEVTSHDRAVSEAWLALRGDVVSPRLTVLIDSNDEYGDDEYGDDEAIRNQAIRDYAARPTLGPVLVVPADDWPKTVAETIAACQAMQ